MAVQVGGKGFKVQVCHAAGSKLRVHGLVTLNIG